MKKHGILNSQLSRIIASMGHGDRLVICDSGLPIPRNAELVDLALTRNIPRFLDTLRIVLEELQVEEAIVAEELPSGNTSFYRQAETLLEGIRLEQVSHENFKQLTRNSQNIAFVRTGEATPFANIILVSGVTFSGKS